MSKWDRPSLERDDRGAAMMLIIGVIAVISVLAVTAGTLSLNNLRNTTRDKQAGSAFATAEAGTAAAIQRIRTGSISVASLACVEPATPVTTTSALPAACQGATMSWTSAVNPMQIDVDTGTSPCSAASTCYKVWIGAVRPYSPPSVRVGLYRIHSRGLFGNGPAARTVVTEVNVKPDPFPIGVFGEKVSGNGGTAIYQESLFTRACVSPRHTGSGNGTRFTGNDVYWDQPASAHSTTMISSSNNCGSNGNIHSSVTNCPNNATLNFDQSADGGPIATSTSCYTGRYTRSDGSTYPDALPTEGCTPRADGLCDSTSFTTKDLQRYGYIPRGLTDAQYANLKARAVALGLYNVSAASLNGLLTTAYGQGVTQPVVYIDCAATTLCGTGATKTYNFSDTDFPSAFRSAPDSGTSMTRCASGAQPVATVVVEHGNVVFQGGNSSWLDGAFFVPDGQWRGNGGYNILGTLFANDLSLGGNETFQLDKCFVRDIPAPLLEIQVVGFREDDALDVS